MSTNGYLWLLGSVGMERTPDGKWCVTATHVVEDQRLAEKLMKCYLDGVFALPGEERAPAVAPSPAPAPRKEAPAAPAVAPAKPAISESDPATLTPPPGQRKARKESTAQPTLPVVVEQPPPADAAPVRTGKLFDSIIPLEVSKAKDYVPIVRFLYDLGYEDYSSAAEVCRSSFRSECDLLMATADSDMDAQVADAWATMLSELSEEGGTAPSEPAVSPGLIQRLKTFDQFTPIVQNLIAAGYNDAPKLVTVLTSIRDEVPVVARVKDLAKRVDGVLLVLADKARLGAK